MSEDGIIPYDLGIGMFCEECGRAKSLRLFGYLTGCAACDEVVTRHRCTSRPAITSLEVGASWTCPDCGTLWTVAEEEEFCSECHQGIGTAKTWDSIPGDRIDTAPRHEPQPFTPLRNAIYQSARTLTGRPAYSPFFGAATAGPAPPGTCHRTDKGIMVHVKPGCRCKR